MRYQRAKARRQLDTEKDAVNILKCGVERKRSFVDRQEVVSIKRRDALIVDEATLGKKGKNWGRTNWFGQASSSNFLFACFPYCLRTKKVVAANKVSNQLRKQANKKLKHEVEERTKLPQAIE